MEKKQEEEVKSKEPNYIPVTHPTTGEVQNLTPNEAMEFIQYGMAKLADEHELAQKKTEETKGTESAEARIEKLEAKIKHNEELTVKEKQTTKILNTLSNTAAKFDLTKNGSPLAEKITIISLARIQQNPRLNPAEVFTNEVNDFMELEKTRAEQLKEIAADNQKVQNAVSGTVRGSGMPIIDTAKEYKAEDLKSNTSREALRKFLESRE